jgi:hypothetical protein
MPLRTLLYVSLYWDRQWHTWESGDPPRPRFRLRPVLPIVLYTGPRPWGSNTRLADLLGEPSVFHSFAPAWQPLFWNLADQTPEQLLQTGREWLQALSVIRAENEDSAVFEQVFTEAVKRLANLHGRDAVRWQDLMRLVLTYVAWRRPEPERAHLFEASQTAQTDQKRKEDIEKMGKQIQGTLADIAMAKAELLLSRRMLKRLLEKRFGPLPEELLERIDNCQDLARLEAAVVEGWNLEKMGDLRL